MLWNICSIHSCACLRKHPLLLNQCFFLCHLNSAPLTTSRGILLGAMPQGNCAFVIDRPQGIFKYTSNSNCCIIFWQNGTIHIWVAQKLNRSSMWDTHFFPLASLLRKHLANPTKRGEPKTMTTKFLLLLFQNLHPYWFIVLILGRKAIT